MSTAIFEPTRKLLESVFATSWSTRTSIRYENVAFTQPANASWVGFFVRWGEALPVSCGTSGTRMERHAGVVLIQVFTPKNSGQNVAAGHCDFAGAVFRMKTFLDSVAGIEVIMRSPAVTDNADENEMLHKTVSVAFQVDALF